MGVIDLKAHIETKHLGLAVEETDGPQRPQAGA